MPSLANLANFQLIAKLDHFMMKQTKLAKIVVLKNVKNVQLLEHVLPALRDMT